MSKKQWGHGYWRGVEDAKNGKVQYPLPVQVKLCVIEMCKHNLDKLRQRSLYPVGEFISFCHFCEVPDPEGFVKKMYEYILKNADLWASENTFFTYITGSYGKKRNWTDDYFVIPTHFTKSELEKEKSKILSAMS